MNEYPILFNAEMVRATLAGYKTQTRRPIEPQPPAMIYKDGSGLWYPTGPWAGCDWRCPFGAPGDSLWIQETHWIDWYLYGTLDASGNPGVVHYQVNHPYPGIAKDIGQKGLWQDAASMPAWASCLTLRVKRVWVERIQDIEKCDAIAEGVYWSEAFPEGYTADGKRGYGCAEHALFNMYGVDCLGCVNPWMWACEFEVVK